MFKESGKKSSWFRKLEHFIEYICNFRVYEDTGTNSADKIKNVLMTSSRTIVATLTEVGSNAALNFLFAFFRRAWQSGQFIVSRVR